MVVKCKMQCPYNCGGFCICNAIVIAENGICNNFNKLLKGINLELTTEEEKLFSEQNIERKSEN